MVFHVLLHVTFPFPDPVTASTVTEDLGQGYTLLSTGATVQLSQYIFLTNIINNININTDNFVENLEEAEKKVHILGYHFWCPSAPYLAYHPRY